MKKNAAHYARVSSDRQGAIDHGMLDSFRLCQPLLLKPLFCSVPADILLLEGF